jgi:DTW domain-containing protein YfiP
MGGRRRFRAARCESCGLHLDLCACATRPRVALGRRLWVVQNDHERHRPTNTGRLVVQVVEDARLLRYAVMGQRFDEAELGAAGDDRRLIFPRLDPAGHLPPELSAAELGPHTQLVLLDGTWAQCSKMARRIACLRDVPARVLPPGPLSHWTVRDSGDDRRVSTMDAAIRVLRVCCGDAPAVAAQRWFDELTARMLFMKGKLPGPDVPPNW